MSTEQTTKFKQYKPKSSSDGQTSYTLREPMLASFPQNIPSSQALKKICFNVSQKETGSVKKRVLKGERKGIKYVGTNYGVDTKAKSQGSDYHIGVYDEKNDTVYTIPVSDCFQLYQEIDGFKETYCKADDNEQLKNTDYYGQKQQLANSFGTLKAQRKLASALTNRVQDEDSKTGPNGQVKTKKKGTKDQRVQQMAQIVQADQEKLRQDLASASVRRKVMYAKAALLPEPLMKVLPYHQTYEALKAEDYNDQLKPLLCSFVVQLAIKVYYQFEQIEEKREKKELLKALVYLDALITLNRMPPQFEFSMDDLSQRFRNMPEEALEKILERFCVITVCDKFGDRAQSRNKSQTVLTGSSSTNFKFVKSGEDTKRLICHIIGLSVILNNNKIKMSFLSKILKKEASDLKMYCTELGMSVDPIKTLDKKTGKNVDDFNVSNRAVNKVQKEEKKLENDAPEQVEEQQEQEE